MNKTFHSYLTGIHNTNFQFKNINEEITMSIIDKLAPKTSCGFDGISSKNYQDNKNYINQTYYFNNEPDVNHWYFP